MALTPFVRLIIGGVLEGAQTWSVGLSYGTTALIPTNDLQTWLSSVSPLVATWFGTTNGPGVMLGTIGNVNQLRAYGYDAGATKSSSEASITQSITGTGSAALPSQCALVISLRSGNSSRHGRGRIYLPMRNASMLSSGQLTSANCSANTAAFKVFNNAVAATTFPGGLAVVPAVATGGSNTVVPITGCQVDSKIDTQRRRTDKVAAAFRAVVAF